MHEIDARDLLCPLPVLRLRKALLSARPGEIMHLLATDPMADIDVPHFCTEQGHLFLGAEPAPSDPKATLYRIRTRAA